MKYIILETLFKWMCKPILLWNITDILTILAEIFIIATTISVVRDIKRKIQDRKSRMKKYLKEYKKLKMRREI